MKLRFGLAVLAAIALALPVAAEDKVVHVYNWSDYIDKDVLADFTKETGIKVVYDTYDSNEVLETKLMAGKTGYDVVAPTSYALARQIQAGVHRKLDKAKLPNLKHMSPVIAERMARYDPGNAHAVVYMWGTTGIGYNAKKIAERMPDAPTGSLRMLFDPNVVKRFADCGVNVLDDAAELFPAALKYLGLDPDSKQMADLEKAEKALMAIRPYIRKFHSSQYIEDLANGDTCLAFGWSGDILQAKARAAEAKSGVEIVYKIPREGAQMWFDSFAIPADAPHPDAAHAFIDYMMRPEVIARCTNAVSYPNGNKDADRFVEAAIKQDPEIYPPPARIATLFTISPYAQRQQTQLNRMWTRIKAGQ
ncbi:polyamine ABC transporter substrate-binding protein [Desertibaculum subflavum]|uniref:polyamine ABC transporter substrate-binding protein n=1 Tax=Desertibaculum subflavum TaxID=2268458 RepID=UPI000E66FF32